MWNLRFEYGWTTSIFSLWASSFKLRRSLKWDSSVFRNVNACRSLQRSIQTLLRYASHELKRRNIFIKTLVMCFKTTSSSLIFISLFDLTDVCQCCHVLPLSVTDSHRALTLSIFSASIVTQTRESLCFSHNYRTHEPGRLDHASAGEG